MVDYLRDGKSRSSTAFNTCLDAWSGLVHERLRREGSKGCYCGSCSIVVASSSQISLTCLHAWSKGNELSILRAESRATAESQPELYSSGRLDESAKPDFQSYAITILVCLARTIPQYFSREILETMLTSVRSGEISSTRNAAAPAVLTAAAQNPRCRPYRQIRDGFNSTVNTKR
jgi:hypothetical protein